MTIKDMHNDIRTKTVVSPAAIGANATKTGVVVDRQGYGGVEFIASYGAVTTTGTVVTLVVKEGDVTGTMTSVANADLLGTEALASLPAATPRTAGTTKEVTKRVGYVGNKRYVSADTVSTGVTSVGVVGVAAVLHSPHLAPTANP
ncbi:MAG: hypothetical protein NUV51_08305 [Sulfuricaulis sp.]|nr:hypothetical protein [Sulfuricaulis sp.]